MEDRQPLTELSMVSDHVAENAELSHHLTEETETIQLPTEWGDIRIVVQGNLRNPAIITWHDIGLDYASCFHNFIGYLSSIGFLNYFSVVHINASGQANGSNTINTGTYPTMDEMALQVKLVVEHLKISNHTCMGAGAGANIMLRYALSHPANLDGLVLIGCSIGSASWGEWTYGKLAQWYLNSNKSVTSFTQENLLSMYFSDVTRERNLDLVDAYGRHLQESINPINLSLYLGSYLRRKSLYRAVKDAKLSIPTLIVNGNHSYYNDEMTDLGSFMDHSTCSTLSLYNVANLAHEEEPFEVARAVVLFMQGLGLAPGLVSRLNELSRDQAKEASHLQEHSEPEHTFNQQ